VSNESSSTSDDGCPGGCLLRRTKQSAYRGRARVEAKGAAKSVGGGGHRVKPRGIQKLQKTARGQRDSYKKSSPMSRSRADRKGPKSEYLRGQNSGGGVVARPSYWHRGRNWDLLRDTENDRGWGGGRVKDLKRKMRKDCCAARRGKS